MKVSEGGASREPKRLSITTSKSILHSSGRIRPVDRLSFDKFVDLYKLLFLRGCWGAFHLLSHRSRLWSLFDQLRHRLRPLMLSPVEAMPLVLNLDKWLKVYFRAEEPSLVNARRANLLSMQ